MRKDGVEEVIFKALVAEMESGGSAAAPASRPAPRAAAPRPAAPQSTLTPQQDAIAAKYRKMMKINLPPPAIQHSMRKDGVEEVIFNALVAEMEGGGGAAAVPALPSSGAPTAPRPNNFLASISQAAKSRDSKPRTPAPARAAPSKAKSRPPSLMDAISHAAKSRSSRTGGATAESIETMVTSNKAANKASGSSASSGSLMDAISKAVKSRENTRYNTIH